MGSYNQTYRSSTKAQLPRIRAIYEQLIIFTARCTGSDPNMAVIGFHPLLRVKTPDGQQNLQRNIAINSLNNGNTPQNEFVAGPKPTAVVSLTGRMKITI
jgi:hypothetical protein